MRSGPVEPPAAPCRGDAQFRAAVEHGTVRPTGRSPARARHPGSRGRNRPGKPSRPRRIPLPRSALLRVGASRAGARRGEAMGQNGCGSGSATGTVVFGADGEIDQSRSSAASELFWQQPCPIEDLNGSWLFEVLPRLPVFFAPRVRGPLRIEVGPSALRCSGDVYTFRPSLTNFGGTFGEPVPVPPVPDPLFGPEPPTGGSDAADGNVIFPGSQAWYPSFPKEQYSWYFRSNGASYANGTLTVAVVRHLWNRATQEFVSTDTGTLVLQCRRGIIGLPFRPQELHDTLTLGDSSSIVKATKTSPMYLGCRVEVDAMVNLSFPTSTTIGSG